MSHQTYLIAKAQRGLEGFAKSLMPGGVPKRAVELSAQERRGMRMRLERQARVREGTLPGLGRTSGVGTARGSRTPYFAEQNRKVVRREKRIAEGEKVSPVRRRP